MHHNIDSEFRYCKPVKKKQSILILCTSVFLRGEGWELIQGGYFFEVGHLIEWVQYTNMKTPFCFWIPNHSDVYFYVCWFCFGLVHSFPHAKRFFPLRLFLEKRDNCLVFFLYFFIVWLFSSWLESQFWVVHDYDLLTMLAMMNWSSQPF